MNVDVPSLDVDGGMVDNQTFVSNLCNTLNIQLNIPESTESTAKGAFYMSALGKNLIDLNQVKNQQKKRYLLHKSFTIKLIVITQIGLIL